MYVCLALSSNSVSMCQKILLGEFDRTRTKGHTHETKSRWICSVFNETSVLTLPFFSPAAQGQSCDPVTIYKDYEASLHRLRKDFKENCALRNPKLKAEPMLDELSVRYLGLRLALRPTFHMMDRRSSNREGR
jgi:hypothetical protein